MDILVLVFATWRVSSLLVNEDGPGNVFDKLRYWTGVRDNEYSQPEGTNVLSHALTCVWCVSIWIGLFWTVLYSLTGIMWPALPFALSAGAILVEGFLNGES